jgi:protein-S-isoprenylcysteine O-methyltransferase Ste14
LLLSGQLPTPRFLSGFIHLLPARVLSMSGIVHPATIEVPQIMGIILGSTGAVVTLVVDIHLRVGWKGHSGTLRSAAPAGDSRAIYRFVRNPMYLGAGWSWPRPRYSTIQYHF